MTTRRRWQVGAALFAIVVALFYTAAFLRVRRPSDLIGIAGMAELPNGAPWRRFLLREIRAGQPLGELQQVAPAPWTEVHPPWAALWYAPPGSFTQMMVLARDDRLVYAGSGSCTWDHVFFDELAEWEWSEYRESRKAMAAARRAEREALQAAASSDSR